MKDVHTPVRQMFYNIITGKGFTCYENGAVPDDAITPYIIVDVSTGENSNKTDFGNDVQILLDVVTSFNKAQVAGSLLCDTMAGQILGSINSKTKLILNSDFQVVRTKVLQDQKINIQTSTHRIFRRLIRYSQLIMEV